MTAMSPTVIDSLVVTLGLDPKAYKDGIRKFQDAQRKAASEEAKGEREVTELRKKHAEAIGEVKRQTLGLVATIIGAGGIEKFVAHQTTSLAALGRTAQAMNMPVRDLAAFQAVIQRNGGSADSAAASLANLTQEMERFKVTGNTPMLPWLNRIGASGSDSAVDIYKKFAKWSQGKDARLVTFEGRNLGFDEAMINEAMKGVDQVNKDLAESYKMGLPDEKQVHKVQALQNAFFHLRQELTQAGNSLLFDATPGMTEWLTWAGGLADQFPGATKAALALGVALTGLGAAKTALGVAAAVTGGGAKAAAGAGGSGLLGAVAGSTAVRLAGPIGAAGYVLFNPTAANVGEDDAIAKLHAAENVRRKAKGLAPIAVPTAADRAKAMIRKRESFRAHAYWDVNHYRVGFGSDTTTDPKTGKIIPVTKDTVVSREQAEADLHRRVTTEFMPRVARQVGAVWASLSAGVQTALTDVAYNYGSLPRDVAAAARSGDAKAIATAIQAHAGDNKRVNAGRRAEEAQTALADGGGPPGAALAAGGAGGPSSTTTVQIDKIEVHTAATDAPGIARDIGGELSRQGLAVQANGGLW